MHSQCLRRPSSAGLSQDCLIIYRSLRVQIWVLRSQGGIFHPGWLINQIIAIGNERSRPRGRLHNLRALDSMQLAFSTAEFRKNPNPD